MEYLFQLIREYLDPSVRFVNKIFTNNNSLPEEYHYILNYLARSSEHHVYTTNFDTLIEKANNNISGLSNNLLVYCRTTHFKQAIKNIPREVIFKLHGSVHDKRTLLMTFDGIRPGKSIKSPLTSIIMPQNPRWKMFGNSLKIKDLCVIGYSGGDDTDVVPTILGVKALDRKIYWFQHDKDDSIYLKFCYANAINENGNIISDDIPDKIRDTTADIIMRKMIEMGNRKPQNLNIIVGKTENIFMSFLNDKLKDPTINCILEKLKKIDYKKNKTSTNTKNFVRGIVKEWYEELPAQKEILRKCLCIELAYQIGFNKVFTQLADELTDITSFPPGIKLIVLQSLSKIAYWLEKPDAVREYLKIGDALWNDFITQKWSINIEDSLLTPHMILSSYIMLNAWFAESIRYYGYDKSKTLTNYYSQNMFAIDKIDKMLRLSVPKKISESSKVFVDGNKFNLWKKKVREISNYWLSTKADILLSIGQYEKAIYIYDKVIAICNEFGDRYKVLLLLLWRADCYYYAGNLSIAEGLYDDIIYANKLAGWNPWMEAHPLLHKTDICRVKNDIINNANIDTIDKYTNYRDDRSIQEIAKILKWALQWNSNGAHQRQKIERQYKLMSKWYWHEVDRAAFNTLYVEYFFAYNDLAGAKKLINRIKKVALKNQLEGILKTLDVYYLEICRLEGKNIIWRKLYEQCHSKKLFMHKCIIICIALVGGNNIDKRIVEENLYWANKNNLEWAKSILTGINLDKYNGTSLPIRFPYCYL